MTAQPRSLAGLVAAGALALATLAAAPAHSLVPAIPLNCSADPDGELVIEHDNQRYDVSGTCGTVRITADGAQVSMPTAQRLVVQGTGNAVTSKSIRTLVVRGGGHHVAPASVKVLRLSADDSTVAVRGLVETATLGSQGSNLRADRAHTVRVVGDQNQVDVHRGGRAALAGDGNAAMYRRLDALRITGTRNLVRVRRGSTEVDSVRGNQVRVNHRG